MEQSPVTNHGQAAIAEEAVPRYRFVVISVLWITAVFLYFDRANISMAAPHIMADLSLSGVQMGLILSMFSWGYVPGQLLGGYVADRYGIRRWALGWYVVWCIATFATGLGRTIGQLMAARFLFGFAEGTVINQVNKMQNHWVFPKERGLSNGGMMFSAYAGLVLGIPLVGWLIELFGWAGMFYVSGIVTIIGVLLFWRFVYDYPKDHPRISLREKLALEEALAKDRISIAEGKAERGETKFKDNLAWLVRNPFYWAMFGSFFFLNMIYYTNFSWLPGYLQMERGFSNVGSGTALVLPYLAAAIGALSGGMISDKLDNRCLVIIVASLVTMPGIAAMLGLDSQMAVIAMLCIIMFCNAAAVSTYVVLLFDIFPPQIVGTALAGLGGISGGLGGVAGPMMMGYSYDLTGSFFTGFAVLGAGMLVSISLMLFVYGHERKVKRQKLGR